jgi:hypothetical protein
MYAVAQCAGWLVVVDPKEVPSNNVSGFVIALRVFIPITKSEHSDAKEVLPLGEWPWLLSCFGSSCQEYSSVLVHPQSFLVH